MSVPGALTMKSFTVPPRSRPSMTASAAVPRILHSQRYRVSMSRRSSILATLDGARCLSIERLLSVIVAVVVVVAVERQGSVFASFCSLLVVRVIVEEDIAAVAMINRVYRIKSNQSSRNVNI